MARPKSDAEKTFCSLRLNLSNPQHVKVAKVLANINTNRYKSKNQFIVDAMEFYIDHYGKDAVMPQKEDPAKQTVNHEELNERLEGRCAELKKEIMTWVRAELYRMYQPVAYAPMMPMSQERHQSAAPQEEDEVISGLVADWD